jgi:hypothetical protein
MDFKQKYLKYKLKYLNLKKKEGINNTNLLKGGFNEDSDMFIINGPVSIGYYSDIKGKKILLFGDQHGTYHNCQEQLNFTKDLKYQTDILRYINYLAKQNAENNSCLDLFMESPYYFDYFSIKNWDELEKDLETVNERFFDPNNNTPIGNNKYGNMLNIIEHYFFKSDCGPIIRVDKKFKNYKNNIMKKYKFKNKCYKGFRYHFWDLGANEIDEMKSFGDGSVIGVTVNILSLLIYQVEESDEYFYNIKEFDNKDYMFDYILSIYTYLTGFKNKKKLFNLGKKNYKNIFDHFKNDNYSHFLQKKNYKKGDLERFLISIKEIEFLSKKIQKQIKNIDKKYFTGNDIYNYWKERIEIGVYEEKYDILKFEKKNKRSIYGDNDWVDVILMSLRDSYVETYSIARMFRKFSPKRKIKNCENKKSLQNIIYVSGDAHTLNFIDFIRWKFNVLPDIYINRAFEKDKFSDVDGQVNQCIVLPKFNPFDFKMPWDE